MEEREEPRGIEGVASTSTAHNSHEAGSSHNGRAHEQGGGTRRTPTTRSGMAAAQEEEKKDDDGGDVAGKGKAPARDRTRRGAGGSSEGVGATERSESPGGSAAGEVAVHGNEVKARAGLKYSREHSLTSINGWLFVGPAPASFDVSLTLQRAFCGRGSFRTPPLSPHPRFRYHRALLTLLANLQGARPAHILETLSVECLESHVASFEQDKMYPSQANLKVYLRCLPKSIRFTPIHSQSRTVTSMLSLFGKEVCDLLFN